MSLQRALCLHKANDHYIPISDIFPSRFLLLYLSIKISKREKKYYHIALGKMICAPAEYMLSTQNL